MFHINIVYIKLIEGMKNLSEKIRLLEENEINLEGEKMFELMETLYPICRSITGNGVRQTLEIINQIIPIDIKEVPTGTKVFDWEVPKEWNIKDAYIKNSKGEKIVDFEKNNLHVLNYSTPIHKTVSLEELKEHLFTLPKYPDWIPYRTSYYNENWGFCITHKQYEELEDDTYEVYIDSSLDDGHLTYGELYIKGESEEEFLLSTYLCHPSLCNDNLSGVVLLTYLAKELLDKDLKYSYRFLFIPETIGAITWLSLNEEKTKNIKYGLVATCVGDRGNITYKKTRNGNEMIDRVVEKVFIDSKQQYKIIDFRPWGSDERQYCSPGFNLPVGSLMRTPYGIFPQYHTSADNLNFIDSNSLADCLQKYLEVIYIIENNNIYVNTNPKCEPQLGKRGLYDEISHLKWVMFWVLNLSDGTNSLLDISIRSRLGFKQIKEAVDLLVVSELLKIRD